MRNALLVTSILLPILIVLAVIQRHYGIESRPNSKIKVQSEKVVVVPQHPALIDKVNAKNAKIRNFVCQDFDVKLWQNGIRLRLSASLYYEKDKNFRMILRSLFGKECDIGSNKDQFWFWSKRMDPSSLFYANHEDYHKTRLRTPFNPIYIMDSLGLSQIDVNNKIIEQDDKYVVVENLKNTIGQPIVKLTFVNKKTEKISGFTISDVNGKVLASGEVMEWDGDKPKQILFVWAEENISLLLEFKNSEVNLDIDKKYWALPPIEPKVDMSKELAAGIMIH